MSRKFVLHIIFVGTILFAIGLVYQCKNPKIESDYYNPEVLATHYNGENFIGSETCMECHADIYNSHLKTAHFNSSAKADENTIHRSFEKGSNILDLDFVRFTMERRQDSFYQHIDIKNRTIKKPPSTFDVVLGSGTRGQSYATWKNDLLFQLQPSYHTPTNSWVNSPGYPSYADSDRPVRGACLKCHVTFAVNENDSELGNRYDKSKIIYGIDCERCHRPAEKHVVYHRENPAVNTAKFMLPLDSLSRQQRLDVCAQCHSGLRQPVQGKKSFSFLSGEILDEYSTNVIKANSYEKPDVHGNQYGLLTRSACFQKTAAMDCTTCHDPHKNQRAKSDFFNQKCLSCHNASGVRCAQPLDDGQSMSNNCIACHMPLSPSKTMKVQLDARDSLQTSFYIRSHFIAVYDKE